jgi:hypothetical protein
VGASAVRDIVGLLSHGVGLGPRGQAIVIPPHGERLAGDVAGRVAREEHDGRREHRWVAHPSGRDPLQLPLEVAGLVLVGHLGDEEARTHGVDPDPPAPAPLRGEVTRESEQPCPPRGVRGLGQAGRREPRTLEMLMMLLPGSMTRPQACAIR